MDLDALSGDEPPEPSVRRRYEVHGAVGYYARFGAAYRNPHEAVVALALGDAVRRWGLDLSSVLDLAAGSGEATLALRQLGAKRVDGVDPYTGDAYARRTGQPAEALSFADVSAGRLEGRRYTLVVCSFALHLCEPSRLPDLMYRLGQVSGAALIVSPHKRPAIRREWGWELKGETLIERVRTRLYRFG